MLFLGGVNTTTENHGKIPTHYCFLKGKNTTWNSWQNSDSILLFLGVETHGIDKIKNRFFAYEKMSVSFCHDRPCRL